MANDLDVMGVAEVAEASGQSKNVIAVWMQRGKIPEPDAVLACGSIWRGSTIRKWLAGLGKQVRR